MNKCAKSEQRPTFVKGHSHIQALEVVSLQEGRQSRQAADLLVGHKREVNGPRGAQPPLLHAPHQLQVLHAHRLHVLDAAPVDVAVLVALALEGVAPPEALVDRHHVRVRVQQDRGLVGTRAQVGHEHHDSIRTHLDFFVRVEADLVGVFSQELHTAI